MPKKHKNTFICKICQQEFPKKQVGRVKMVKRLPKGEESTWICSKCQKERIKIV
ncbi:MAG: hypothetical protein ACFFCM_03720 [Promethearchaeota archaeon]